MATYYSDHFTGTGISQTSADKTHRAPPGTKRTHLYKDRIYVKALAVTTDLIRFTTLGSGTRIYEMLISGDDAAAAGALNLGLHKSTRHGGAVIDADVFASAVAKNASRVDAFEEAATLGDFERGEFLWQLADAGDATYTADPQEEWDITGTPSTSFTTTAQGFLLEILYSLGS
jgi:hypothetical protein